MSFRQTCKFLAAIFFCVGYPNTNAATHSIPFVPSASDPLREGFVRVINHSDSSGQARIFAIDDSGREFGPITLSLKPYQARHFNSGDLELGNPDKGFAGVGGGTGDWRLVLDSDLDIEPLAYVRTADGFITSVHDLVREVGDENGMHIYAAPILNPGSNVRQAGRLRLANPGKADANVIIRALDDAGRFGKGGDVRLVVPAGSAGNFGARDLENGRNDIEGRLGDGAGKWRVSIESDQPLLATSLLVSPTANLTNLSSGKPGSETVRQIPYFLSSGHPDREGFARIINHSEESGEVSIHAIDDTGVRRGPITLTMGQRRTVQFNSTDLEQGNESKGLANGVGTANGDWRLTLTSGLDIEALAYIRSSDGFLTSIHDLSPATGVGTGNRHRVSFFNPGSNQNQVSRIRVVNSGEAEARVLVRAWDDDGAEAPGGTVEFSVPPSNAQSFDSSELETGAEDIDGMLGDGTGKWRLLIESNRPIEVMSLLESPGGFLANLSTSTTSGPHAVPHAAASCTSGDQDEDGICDSEDTEPTRAYRQLSLCSNGVVVDDPENNPGLVAECRVLLGVANLFVQRDAGSPLTEWGLGSQERIDDWSRVTVQSGELVHLNLSGLRLTGSIPPELGQLTNLELLELRVNQLSGGIPPELGQLANLEILSLSENELTGSIPPELGQLTNLESLVLHENQLSGGIPPELGQLTNLRWLQLYENQLTGSIPPELGQLTKLRTFYLNGNQLSGSIPPELGQLTNLGSLHLNGNQLTGGIPPELGQLANLGWLELYENQLSGSIPPELGQLTKLFYLCLHKNQLSGRIPLELGQLSSLTQLRLDENELTGSIPPELGQLTNLQTLYLHENQLSGSIPPELGQLTNLSYLRLHGNQLSGGIPAELGLLRWLWILTLHDNQLTGTVPPELGNLMRVISLTLDNNPNLSGYIPEEISGVTSYSGTQISGVEPPPGGGNFNIAFSWGDDLPSSVRDGFRRAADRWERIILDDFPDPGPFDIAAGSCGQETRQILLGGHDLWVFVDTADISSAAKAWICIEDRRTPGIRVRPVVGRVAVNHDRYADGVDDAEFFYRLAIHELGHVLGFTDSVFQENGYFQIDPDPRFSGANATAAFRRSIYDNDGYDGKPVPLDSDGSHWKMEAFAFAALQSGKLPEIMAPGIFDNSIISAVTLGALADLGYTVDTSQAEHTGVSPPSSRVSEMLDLRGDLSDDPNNPRQ